MAGLKSLSVHNKERYEAHVTMATSTPLRNGLECPNCREELFDSDPMSTLTVCPPQKAVHCSVCNFRGTRLA